MCGVASSCLSAVLELMVLHCCALPGRVLGRADACGMRLHRHLLGKSPIGQLSAERRPCLVHLRGYALVFSHRIWFHGWGLFCCCMELTFCSLGFFRGGTASTSVPPSAWHKRHYRVGNQEVSPTRASGSLPRRGSQFLGVR